MSWQQPAHVSITGKRRERPSIKRPRPLPHFKLVFGGRKNKEQGRTRDQSQRSSSHAQPGHHPLKTLAQPGGKRKRQRCRETGIKINNSVCTLQNYFTTQVRFVFTVKYNKAKE